MEGKAVRRSTKSQAKKPIDDSENEMLLRTKFNSYKSRKRSRNYKLYGAVIIIFVLILFVYQCVCSSFHQATFIDNVYRLVGLYESVYVVIIDAGSTGSRVLALSFYKPRLGGNLKLSDDLFVYNKPGLSSFANNPKEGAEKITSLLEQAKKFVPENAWSKTPVALRATAGLRLLPADKAENILDEVRTVIEQSPFQSDSRSVSIMDGKDEGLFSWFTINFLLDHLNKDIKQSVATIDLGGGSVQITFTPETTDRIMKETPDHLYSVSIHNQAINTYSYSYLGLGLMAARMDVFLKENDEGSLHIRTSCVHPTVKNATWKYAGKTFNIEGSKTNAQLGTYDRCAPLVNQVVAKHAVDKPREIEGREIIAISYFYDRAKDCGLVGEDDSSDGLVSIQDFKDAAIKTCEISNPDRPFLCIDLTFIASVLENGFGLSPSTYIRLLDTVDGHEISWALGAGYSILEDQKS